MNSSLIAVFLMILKWGSILLCAYALILGCLSLFGLLVNVVKGISGKDQFRFYYWAKVALAAAVAYGYYFLYQYKGFTPSFIKSDTPKAVIIILVCLCVPIGVLQASDYLFLTGSTKKK